MAFNLSDRIGSKGRIANDEGSGFRANTADFSFSAGTGDRGGTGDVEGSNTGGPHSASGFRRALEHSERSQGKLSSSISANKDNFSVGKNRKPNYFAQGQRRHGMHMGAGAPVTTPAMDTGSETGE